MNPLDNTGWKLTVSMSTYMQTIKYNCCRCFLTLHEDQNNQPTREDAKFHPHPWMCKVKTTKMQQMNSGWLAAHSTQSGASTSTNTMFSFSHAASASFMAASS